MSLVDFLNARLNEDEAAARAATAGPWTWRAGRFAVAGESDEVLDGDFGPELRSETATWFSPEGRGPYPATVLSGWGHDAWGLNVEDADAAHIAQHDPARVLRDVEAKRKLIRFAFENAAAIDGEWGDDHDAKQIAAGLCADHGNDAANDILLELAAVYSDHPDYRPEWA